MKECEPNETPSSSPLALIAKDDVPAVTVFNKFFCYIAHTFFTFRSAKKLKGIDMKRLHGTEKGCSSVDDTARESTSGAVNA